MAKKKKCAGYKMVESLPVELAGLDAWRGEGPDGLADVYLTEDDGLQRASSLPRWGPFAATTTGVEGKWSYAIVPGGLSEDLFALSQRLTPESCLGVALHIATAMAEMHERGESHGTRDLLELIPREIWPFVQDLDTPLRWSLIRKRRHRRPIACTLPHCSVR